MPRDVRYKVISEEFSQKQRVLLQKWMAEFAEKESVPADPQESSRQTRAKTGQKSCKMKPKSSKRAISGTRGVISNGWGYMASVCWDGIQINSRGCNLATALEYLVIITSAKHKMQDHSRRQGVFEEDLEQTLRSSAEEHGRTLEEVKVRFRTYLNAGMFIGRYHVSSPYVDSYEDLRKLRQCMEPVRALRKQNTGNFFKSISPSEFQECWEQFQKVVAGMFQLAGHDTKQPLHRIRTWYEARRHVRTKYLQQWEGHSMARHDKTKHVPQYLKYRLWRNPLTDNLQLLKTLLVRWQNVLQKEVRDLEKQRRQVAQQRKRERGAQREARWKRMHDPNLTMDDILGPPKQPAEPDKRTLVYELCQDMAAVLDGHCTLYDVLQAQEDATVDEIKAAFKRRALEVHPDKGGSKEAFHQVYQAFETLSDTKARQKYDDQLRGSGQPVLRSQVQAATSNGGRKRAKTQGESAASAGGSSADGVRQAVCCKTRLMKRIHALLKQVPRDVRYKVISEEFSQKQRVLLQKWMADFAEKEDVPADPQETARRAATKTGAKRRKTKPKTSRKTASGTKGVCSTGGYYMASVGLEGMQINSRLCDLATAVEYLVILTSTKHKMQDHSRRQGIFEEHLEQALTASAAEHGRMLEELKLRFRVVLLGGMFIGDHQVVSPFVYSFEALQELRRCMEPVRALRKISTGNFFKSISPSEFQECWEQFQQVVAGMFQVAGRNTEQPLDKIRTWYDAHQHAHDLEKQRRQVAQQRKREREAQREARWKRMHDPNLTMDDILGPPKQPAEPDKRTSVFELFIVP
eukprot:s590_g44.t1